MYEKVLDALSEMIDEIGRDEEKIVKQRQETMCYIKNSRSWTQFGIAIKMLVINIRRYMLLRDRITFVKKTQKEIDKRFKRIGV